MESKVELCPDGPTGTTQLTEDAAPGDPGADPGTDLGADPGAAGQLASAILLCNHCCTSKSSLEPGMHGIVVAKHVMYLYAFCLPGLLWHAHTHTHTRHTHKHTASLLKEGM